MSQRRCWRSCCPRQRGCCRGRRERSACCRMTMVGRPCSSLRRQGAALTAPTHAVVPCRSSQACFCLVRNHCSHFCCCSTERCMCACRSLRIRDLHADMSFFTLQLHVPKAIQIFRPYQPFNISMLVSSGDEFAAGLNDLEVWSASHAALLARGGVLLGPLSAGNEPSTSGAHPIATEQVQCNACNTPVSIQCCTWALSLHLDGALLGSGESNNCRILAAFTCSLSAYAQHMHLASGRKGCHKNIKITVTTLSCCHPHFLTEQASET